MENQSKNMQDKSPHDVRCGKCSELLVSSKDAKKYTEDEIAKIARNHKCKESI